MTRERELAPRDIVARAIDAEMKRTGAHCVYLDITHKPAEFIRERFPNIYETCLALGIDMTPRARSRWCPPPITSAAACSPTWMARTSLRGLYAIGEVACTGLHGANRLASNSLLEGLRAGASLRAADAARAACPLHPRSTRSTSPSGKAATPLDVDELVVIYHNWDEIRRLMWDYVGIVRTDKRLQRAGARLRNLQREIQEFYWDFKITTDLLELRNLATVAALIVDSALRARRAAACTTRWTTRRPTTATCPGAPCCGGGERRSGKARHTYQ